MLCSTDTDCLPLTYVAGNASRPDWCVLSAECNTEKGACVVWPRCRNVPYYGCIAASQLCESTRFEDNPPPCSGTNLSAAIGIPWNPSAPSFLIPFLFLLLLGTVLVALFSAWRMRRDCCAGIKASRHRHPEVRERLRHLDEGYTQTTNLF